MLSTISVKFSNIDMKVKMPVLQVPLSSDKIDLFPRSLSIKIHNLSIDFCHSGHKSLTAPKSSNSVEITSDWDSNLIIEVEDSRPANLVDQTRTKYHQIVIIIIGNTLVKYPRLTRKSFIPWFVHFPFARREERCCLLLDVRWQFTLLRFVKHFIKFIIKRIFILLI